MTKIRITKFGRTCVPQAAEKSICFYQNLNDSEKHTEILRLEMQKLRNIIESSSQQSSKSWEWSDFKTIEARKAFTIGIVLSFLNKFCGGYAMLSYSATIFKESGASMAPNTSSIVVGAIQLIGSYVATNLVDRAGRKVRSCNVL